MHTNPDHESIVAEVVARFAPESLGLRLTPEAVERAARAGVARAIDAGPNTGETLAVAAERAIRREVPTAHQGLVGEIAKGYLDRGAAVGLSFEDFYLEGQLGLIRAAELYDPARGVKFSTYAHRWVRSFMHHLIRDEPRIARIPVYLAEQIARLRAIHGKAYKKHLDDNMRAAIRLRRTRLIREFEDRGSYQTYHTFRLDSIVDHRAAPPSPDDGLVPALLALLNPEERAAVVARHGLGVPEQTVLEIAREAGCTRSRVERRIDTALGLLRREVERRGLDYADCLAS